MVWGQGAAAPLNAIEPSQLLYQRTCLESNAWGAKRRPSGDLRRCRRRRYVFIQPADTASGRGLINLELPARFCLTCIVGNDRTQDRFHGLHLVF